MKNTEFSNAKLSTPGSSVIQKQLSSKYKMKNITAISFSRKKPIHKRSSTREYSNLGIYRPKTSGDTSDQSFIKSHSKVRFKSKEYIDQSFTGKLNNNSKVVLLRPSIKNSKYYNDNYNYNTVDRIDKRDVVINNIAFNNSYNSSNTIMSRKDKIINQRHKSHSTINGKSASVLQNSNRAQSRENESIIKVKIGKHEHRIDPNMSNGPSLNLDAKIVGKSYNNQSHIIVNKFMNGVEQYSHSIHNRAKTLSILHSNNKWLSISKKDCIKKSSTPGLKGLYSAGRSCSMHQRYKGKLYRTNKACSFHLIQAESSPQTIAKLDSNYIDETSQDMLVKFSPEMLKQCLQISKASQADGKRFKIKIKKSNGVQNNSIVSIINKRTIHVKTPESREYQILDYEKLDNYGES